jgi:hypothetical protein
LKTRWAITGLVIKPTRETVALTLS